MGARPNSLTEGHVGGIKGQVQHLSQLKTFMKLSLPSDLLVNAETKQPVPQ